MPLQNTTEPEMSKPTRLALRARRHHKTRSFIQTDPSNTIPAQTTGGLYSHLAGSKTTSNATALYVPTAQLKS